MDKPLTPIDDTTRPHESVLVQATITIPVDTTTALDERNLGLNDEAYAWLSRMLSQFIPGTKLIGQVMVVEPLQEPTPHAH